ncbi:MAG: cation:proton antiporter [Rhizobiales bacterium]|nr:cation:proton antiporter [Hyphomicrobiales bacterium]
MNNVAEIPPLAAFLTAAFLIAGAGLALVGSLGLLRLRSFYERVHAPTLGTTLGVGCIATSSIIYFSTLAGQPVFHEILIIVFVAITTPITLMVLVRAALFRDQSEAHGASMTSIESSAHPHK